MRILHLNEHLEWKGGVEVYLLSLLPELEKRGHDVAVGYTKGRSELVARALQMPELSRADKAARHAGYRAAESLIKDFRPDVVHIHQTHNQGVIEACLDQVPALIHGHDYRYLCPASTFFYKRSQTICPRAAGLGCFGVTLARHCLTPRPQYAIPYYQRVQWAHRQRDRFAHVIAPSESCRQRFLQASFAGDRVTTLPYFCPVDVQAAPRPLPQQPTVLFIGRVRPNKGYSTFVEALSQLPGVRGIMIGDFTAQTRTAVLNIAEQLDCADRLDLRPWAGRDEISAAFAEASVFVFPSIWPETLGIVGLESLATGVPVVASDVGGVREWLRDGENGFLVPPKDSAALAARLKELLDSPETNRVFGEQGIAYMRQKFAVPVHTDQLEAIYRAAAGGP